MNSSIDISLHHPASTGAPAREAVVQERPTLGSMPRLGRHSWSLAPGIDLLASTVALTAVVLLAGGALFPALPVAPLVLVAASAAVGLYGSATSGDAGTQNRGWAGGGPVQLLLAALFVWSASLLTPLGASAQLGLWALFLLLHALSWSASSPLRSRLDAVERWVLVGDEATAERLRAYPPLRAYAKVVCTVPPSADLPELDDIRVSALEVVDRYGADRVVIGSRQADDKKLLDLVRAFKSTGVAVSMLPRPLDLLEAPAAMPKQVGGVPLIDVQQLSAHDAVPYTGPDRRHSRHTKVSVVVPAMNEEKNIGEVLGRLPADLHEVILVDGNSHDRTIEAARAAYPDDSGLHAERPRQGRRPARGLRRGDRRHHRDARRRRLGRPVGDPPLRRGARGGSRLRQGLPLPRGRRQRRHHARCAGSATASSAAPPTSCTGRASPTSATATTPSGPAACPFISLDGPGFEVETLINLRIAGAGLNITEVPSYEEDRMHGESNLNTFRDGFRVLRTILKEARRSTGRRCVPSDRRARRQENRRGDGVGHEPPPAPGLGRRLDLRPETLGRPHRLRRVPRSTDLPSARGDRGRGPQRAVAREGTAALPAATVIANERPRGLAGARNMGIGAAEGEVVAFIDDDARAESPWLERLMDCFEQGDSVVGCGGALIPRWEGAAATWIPAEFYWVFGCSYAGLPEEMAPVRNPIGANMAVRASVLREVGGFREGASEDAPRELRSRGVVRAAGNIPDDTDLAIRVEQHRDGDATWLYQPTAKVLHTVTAERTTLGYFLRRCYEEGVGKANLSGYVGAEDGLSSERRHLMLTIPRGIGRELRRLAGGDRSAGLRAAAILVGLCATATGFLAARLAILVRGDSTMTGPLTRSETPPPSPDFEPVQMDDVEIGAPLPTLTAGTTAGGARFAASLCMVRLHGRLLGLLQVELPAEGLAPEALAARIDRALGDEVAEHLRADGLPQPAHLDADGIPAADTPLCLVTRDALLAAPPRLSVVICTRNRPDSVRTTLASILACRYPADRWEAIVVDNASSADESVAQLAERKRRRDADQGRP